MNTHCKFPGFSIPPNPPARLWTTSSQTATSSHHHKLQPRHIITNCNLITSSQTASSSQPVPYTSPEPVPSIPALPKWDTFQVSPEPDIRALGAAQGFHLTCLFLLFLIKTAAGEGSENIWIFQGKVLKLLPLHSPVRMSSSGTQRGTFVRGVGKKQVWISIYESATFIRVQGQRWLHYLGHGWSTCKKIRLEAI